MSINGFLALDSGYGHCKSSDLIKVGQPHDLLLLVLALELDHALAVVLHCEEVSLVLDPRVLVYPDLNN